MKLRLLAVAMVAVTASVFANDFGAKGASTKNAYTLDEMLAYAIEDEHMALAEYQAIMKKFGEQRPYRNIAESEKTHIQYLENLYASLGMKVPEVDAGAHVSVPSTLAEAARIGIDAEIANITMYERFLKEDLPSEVREVFVLLKNASENHLEAFKRQLDTGGQGFGRNQDRKK